MPGPGSAPARGDLRLSVLRGAGEVPRPAWDSLARRGFHARGWWEAAEGGGTLEPRLVAAGDRDGTLLCVIPAYVQRSALHGDLHDRWLGPLAALSGRLGLLLRPSLAVTPPLSTASDPLGEVAGLPEPVLQAAFDLLEETARAERARAVAFPFLERRHEPLVRMGLRRGYVAVFAGSRAVLDVPWSSFEEYVASRSKSLRYTIRAEIRALAALGAECVETPDFADRAVEMDALYRTFFLRRNGRAPDLDPGFFARAARSAAGGVRAQLTTLGGRLVATSLNAVAAGHQDCGFAACAAAHAGGPVYHNDLVYQPVRAACAAGVRTVDLGPGALYPKVLRGARLEPRTALVRGLSPPFNAALRALGSAVGRRNVSKELRALGGLARRAGVAPGVPAVPAVPAGGPAP